MLFCINIDSWINSKCILLYHVQAVDVSDLLVQMLLWSPFKIQSACTNLVIKVFERRLDIVYCRMFPKFILMNLNSKHELATFSVHGIYFDVSTKYRNNFLADAQSKSNTFDVKLPAVVDIAKVFKQFAYLVFFDAKTRVNNLDLKIELLVFQGWSKWAASDFSNNSDTSTLCEFQSIWL